MSNLDESDGDWDGDDYNSDDDLDQFADAKFEAGNSLVPQKTDDGFFVDHRLQLLSIGAKVPPWKHNERIFVQIIPHNDFYMDWFTEPTEPEGVTDIRWLPTDSAWFEKPNSLAEGVYQFDEVTQKLKLVGNSKSQDVLRREFKQKLTELNKSYTESTPEKVQALDSTTVVFRIKYKRRDGVLNVSPLAIESK